MKKWLVGGVVVIVVTIIALGNMNWNQKVEETVKEAEVALEEKQEAEENKDTTRDFAVADDKEESKSLTASSNNQSGAQTGSVSTEKNQTASGTPVTSTGGTAASATNSGTTSETTTKQSEEKEVVLEKLSLGKIKDKYFLEFRELEKVQNKQLDELYLEAINEYEYYTFNKITFSRSEFLAKYQARASLLETEADVAVYRTYEKMIKELDYNGYSTIEADAYLNVYETTKERRRNSLLNILN